MKNILNRNISAGMLINFSLPTILSLIFIGLYTTVDGIFVSRLIGTNALSAVNILMPVYSVALALGLMFGSGGSAVVAKKMGEKDNIKARKIFSLIFFTALTLSILFSVLGLLFLEPLIKFLGADEILFKYCIDYSIPLLIFFPFLILSMVFQAFFIASGRPGFELILSIIGGTFNLILDYVFIAIFDMGITGAAIATGIGYSLPVIAGVLFFSLKRKETLFFVIPDFDIKSLLKTCSNGSSEMVTTLSVGVTTLLFNHILMKISGPDGVASITIILYAYNLLSSAYVGYSMGIAPIISYNYGAKNTKHLLKIHKESLFIIKIVSAITLIFAVLSASSLVSVFAPKDSSVYNIAINGYKLFVICFLFMGFNIYSSAMFTALSNGRISAMLSFLRTLVFVISCILLLPLIIGINGIWLAIPIAEILGFAVTILCFKKILPRQMIHFNS